MCLQMGLQRYTRKERVVQRDFWLLQHMLPAVRMRPNQTHGYCVGIKQDGELARPRLSTLGGRH